MEWFFDEPELQKVPLQPVRVNWVCPKCKLGVMIYLNSMWPTGDPGYHHKCSNCDYYGAIKGKTYPHVSFEDVE